MSLDDGIAILHVHVLIHVVVESGATTERPMSTNNVVYQTAFECIFVSLNG